MVRASQTWMNNIVGDMLYETLLLCISSDIDGGPFLLPSQVLVVGQAKYPALAARSRVYPHLVVLYHCSFT